MTTKIVKTKHLKLQPIIGFGYWKDIYKIEEVGINGISHNVIIPFVRIQWAYLIAQYDD